MNAITRLARAEPMTIDEFLAFTATRPPGERWELIEGAATMTPSPVDWHQLVVANIVARLMRATEETGATWTPLIGTGTRTPSSPNSLPQPDVMVKEHPLTGTPASEDALVVVEVLSQSNSRKWRRWRLDNYPSIPNCQHYFTVSMERVEVECFDRATGWQARRLNDLAQTLDLPALGTRLRLADIYWRTPLADAKPPARRGTSGARRAIRPRASPKRRRS